MKTEQASDRIASRLRGMSAILDIAIVIAVSAAAYFAEDWARGAGLITLGEDSRGVLAVLVGAVTAVGLTLARGGSLKDLGFRRPHRWWTVPFWVVGILVAYIVAQALASWLVSMFVDLPTPDLSRYEAYQGNLLAAISFALILPFTASIPEEIVYRGFLMDRLTGLFGAHAVGALFTVMGQALIFGLVHFQWGLGGIVVTMIMGSVWGAAFLMCGRNLWIVILAHSAGHILMAIQLYLAPAAS